MKSLTTSSNQSSNTIQAVWYDRRRSSQFNDYYSNRSGAEAAIDVYTLQIDHINSNFRYRAFMYCVKNLKIIFLLQFWYEWNRFHTSYNSDKYQAAKNASHDWWEINLHSKSSKKAVSECQDPLAVSTLVIIKKFAG